VSLSPITYTILAVLVVVLATLRAWLHRSQRLEGWFGFLARVEVGVITVLLGALVLLGCMQIFLRNFFHSGIIWADPLMRHIVLWLGFLGAMLATTRVRHINIDVFTRLLPGPVKPVRRFVVYSATTIAAFVLGVAALRLVADERAFGDVAFGSVKTWTLQLVMPVAFFVISYRSLVNLFADREPDPSDGELESLEP
jgi:TRAP-type C4-dicarboxylate transport system permease small subunit